MPYRDIEKQNGRRRQRYIELKQKGLCVRCRNAAIPGHTRCVICSHKDRLKAKEWYQLNRERILKRNKDGKKKIHKEELVIWLKR
jgi:hypothetical protein